MGMEDFLNDIPERCESVMEKDELPERCLGMLEKADIPERCRSVLGKGDIPDRCISVIGERDDIPERCASVLGKSNFAERCPSVMENDDIPERCSSVMEKGNRNSKKKSRKSRAKKMPSIRPFSVIGSSTSDELHVDIPKRPETSFHKIESQFLYTSDGDKVSALAFKDDESPLTPKEIPRYLTGGQLSQFYGLKAYQINSGKPHWRRHLEKLDTAPTSGTPPTFKLVETTEKWLSLYEDLYKATI